MKVKIFIIGGILLFHVVQSFGQKKPLEVLAPGMDTVPITTVKVKQRDIRDVVHDVFQPHKIQKSDSTEIKDTLKHYSFVPAFGYTLQTGVAAILSANLGYYNDIHKNTKLSSVTTNFTYSQYKQIIVPFQADIWSKENRLQLHHRYQVP